MRPTIWQPPFPLAPTEAVMVSRISCADLVIYLRRQRHAIFDATLQEELSTMCADSILVKPPVPPAHLALATLRQAQAGVSEDEVSAATLMDRRWQLVLDFLDCPQAPLSTETLVALRERLIAADPDRRLIERTVAVAAATKGFAARLHLYTRLISGRLSTAT